MTSRRGAGEPEKPIILTDPLAPPLADKPAAYTMQTSLLWCGRLLSAIIDSRAISYIMGIEPSEVMRGTGFCSSIATTHLRSLSGIAGRESYYLSFVYLLLANSDNGESKHR
jgi:hypothetical protein